jgi:hypothetical protein
MSGIYHFFCPPPSVVQQKFSQLATSGMRRGLVGAEGGVWFGGGIAFLLIFKFINLYFIRL